MRNEGNERRHMGHVCVAGNVLVSLHPKEAGNGFDYDLAIFHLGEGNKPSIRYMTSGAVLGFDANSDDALEIALAGALPSQMADEASVLHNDPISFSLDGADEKKIAKGLGLESVEELGDLMRRAIGSSGENKVLTEDSQTQATLPTSQFAKVVDADGNPISIGDWIRVGSSGRIHRIVGIAINEFHGAMIMVDDPITGGWFSISPDTHVIGALSSWEDLIDAAASKALSKKELVAIAEELARLAEQGR